jgi:hypothetical protein
MHSLNRRLPWRAIVTALLAAPALSLLAAASVVWGVGNVLSPSLPLGMHTLVPLALLLPMPVLVAVAFSGLVLAGLVHACRSERRADGPIGAVQGAVLLLAAQSFLLAAQLVFVWQVNGIPDAALSLVAAAVLQAVVLGVATGAAVAVGLVLAAVSARVLGSSWLASPARRATLMPVFVRSPVYRLGTRRGPPPFLLSD